MCVWAGGWDFPGPLVLMLLVLLLRQLSSVFVANMLIACDARSPIWDNIFGRLNGMVTLTGAVPKALVSV